jgi:hypothetical protein
MNSYAFHQRCRPRGDFRLNEIVDFFSIMKVGLNLSDFFDKNDKPLELSTGILRNIFEKKLAKERFPGIGVVVHFFSIQPSKRDDKTIRFEIHTGTHPDEIFIDSYDIEIGDSNLLPDLEYFKKSIKIFNPFEAFLSEFSNESELKAYDRQQAIPKFNRPAIIRGFHYLDKYLASSVGGIERCLKAPAWKVERFCDGVLIQLTEDLFDSENPDHIKIQKEVMKYLKV